MMLSLIVALDKNGLIGVGNNLPWKLPADLKHFKITTMGKPIVMGRKTCESIGRPLPGRRNIVLSRDPHFNAEGFDLCHSANELVGMLQNTDEAIIIGGAEIYRIFLDQVSRAYVTLVDGTFEGDTWFPQWPLRDGWNLIGEDKRAADNDNPHAMSFLTYERSEN